MAPLLTLQDIRLSYGGTPLLDGAELHVEESERLCLVGRNGSGKSTLLKLAAGLIEPDSGERFAQRGITIRYLPQEPDFSGYATAGDYARAGLGPSDDAHRVTYLLNALGLTGDENVAQISGGEARRAALVRVLAPSPDILLLDEPTNHLDLPAIEWLENELATMRSALVLISHDRRFLTQLSTGTLWLDRGKTRRFDWGFSKFEACRDELLEQEEIERHKLDRKIAAELDWVRHGVSGRRKRNQGRLAGLEQLRQQRREQRQATGDVRLKASEGDVSGTLVLEAKQASKAYNGRCIVRDFSVRILRGDRVGIVGPNGAGKTTLVNLLTGRLAPDSGIIRIGANVNIAALDQDRRELLPDATVAEVMTEGQGNTVTISGRSRHVVSYMKDFLFTPEQARTPMRVLSGGERARLQLARALATPSNLLVLDEPTNDLDLETLDLLQEMIADYPGTIVIVSHDRDFLDRTVATILMYEGEGRFVEYAGGYSDMIAQRGEGMTAKPVRKPQRRTIEHPSAVSTMTIRRRLSFKDKHALKELPAQIAQFESEIASLQNDLSDNGLFLRQPSRFSALTVQLAEAQKLLTEHEDRWIALEILRSEIEGAA
jgi:ATP-binding cassette subfamily F protein uup